MFLLDSVVNSLSATSPRYTQFLHALASAVFARESEVPPTSLAAVNLLSAVSLPVEGMHSLVGGYEALRLLLSRSVRYSGGCVVREVPVCGVKLSAEGQACGVRVGSGGGGRIRRCVEARHGVVSGVGLLCTYSRLLPEGAPIDYSIPRGLREARPKMYVVLQVPSAWMSCTAREKEPFNGEYIETALVAAETSAVSPPTPSLFSNTGYVRLWRADTEPANGISDRCVLVLFIGGHVVADILC